MDIQKKSLPEQHYIYVDREATFTTPGAIAEAMSSGFGAIFGFTQEKSIAPQSMPSTIYMEMPTGDKMKFRAGVFVSADDAAKAEGDVHADVMPAGDAMTATHRGPYANLNQTHKAVWDHLEAEGLKKGMPVWEIYVDDPTTVPEAECRTEVFCRVG